MIYIKCTRKQINTIINKAKVRVSTDKVAIDYIAANPKQGLCLIEVTNNGLLGIKYQPDNMEVIDIGDEIGKGRVSKQRVIKCSRNLTDEEKEAKRDKANKKKHAK